MDIFPFATAHNINPIEARNDCSKQSFAVLGEKPTNNPSFPMIFGLITQLGHHAPLGAQNSGGGPLFLRIRWAPRGEVGVYIYIPYC